MWDGIKDAFKGAVNWIIEKWNNLQLKIGGQRVDLPFGQGFTIPSITLDTPNIPLLAGGGIAGRTDDGTLYGPGTGTSDSILGVDAWGMPTALVSARERVMSLASRGLGDNDQIQQAMNAGAAFDLGGLQRLAGGGLVGGGLVPWNGGGGEGNLKPPAVLARRLIKKYWDEIETIGGYRAQDAYPDHPSGLALDIMIPGFRATSGQRLGGQIRDWLHENAKVLGLDYLIWRQKYEPTEGTANKMEDRGSDTQNHMDHIHSLFNAGMPDVTMVPEGLKLPAHAKKEAAEKAAEPKLSPRAEHEKKMADRITENFGNAGKSAIEGQMQDALGIFSIGDSPPLLAAYNRYLADRADYEQMVADQADYDTEQKSVVAAAVGDSASDLNASVAAAMPTLDNAPKIEWVPSAGAEQWRPLLEWAIGYVGHGLSAVRAQLDAGVKQVDTESGGNPGITQQVRDVNSGGNEAVGLLQIIPGTWRAHRDPDLPDDRRDPVANVVGALRYYVDRYGTDLTTKWGKGRGYRFGGWVSGPGTGTSDSIPARLSNREFVTQAAAAAQSPRLLEGINAGRITDRDLAPAGAGRAGPAAGPTFVTHATFRNEHEFWEHQTQQQRLTAARMGG